MIGGLVLSISLIIGFMYFQIERFLYFLYLEDIIDTSDTGKFYIDLLQKIFQNIFIVGISVSLSLHLAALIYWIYRKFYSLEIQLDTDSTQSISEVPSKSEAEEASETTDLVVSNVSEQSTV